MSSAVGEAQRGLTSAWRVAIVAVGSVWLALVLMFRSDWSAMVGQWWHSSTYTHVLLVPLILVWLVHIRWSQLSALTPRPWWPGLVLFAIAATGWLLGSLGSLAIVSQAGAVAMLATAAIALLGPKVSAGLAFPLGYTTFLVPFGDELVPVLQLVTAKLTVALVELSGLAATIDGVFIQTQAGLFEVAEACSGVKFLIAMIAFAVLVANVCFRSWPRRIAFVAFAAGLSIVANGVRAWGTIFVAQFVGAERATGFDHLVYGWIFFALVIGASLAIGWRFFDRAPGEAMIDEEAIAQSTVLDRLERCSMGLMPTMLALIGTAAFASTWSAAALRLEARVPARIALPNVPDWDQVAYRPLAPWRPRAHGADHRVIGRFRDRDGHEVDVFYALYAAQRQGQEAGSFGEGALPPDSGWAWLSPGPAVPGATVDRLLGPGRVERVAETRYRSEAVLTGSPFELKLTLVADRLLLRSRPTAVLILSSETRPGMPAEASLRAFRASAGPLGRWMDRMAAVR